VDKQQGRRGWRLIGTGLAAAAALSACQTPVQRAPITKTVYLEQNWSAGERTWFHHATQGTATLPVDYEWFLALEQAGLTLTERPLFSDPENLRSWGFIDSPRSAENPDGLPVGFARTANFVVPGAPSPSTPRNAIGLTCAACHTGQFTYRGTQVVVDGGPSQANVTGMGEALGLAVVETLKAPRTFDRFARRVLKDRYDEASVAELRGQLRYAVQQIGTFKDLTDDHKPANVPEGYGRLDALNRIGNQVFSIAARRPQNFAATNAPVSYPAIWSTSWFDWVQYDGSIMQPMVRNAGEALGVAAGVNLGSGPSAFSSTVNMDSLRAIESLLAGKAAPAPARAFSGLASPKWPEAVLGPLDRTRAARGRQLYGELCAGCHLPSPDTPEFWSSRHWKPMGGGTQAYLALPVIPLAEIGTDPAQAAVLATRTVDTRGLGVNARLWQPRKAAAASLGYTPDCVQDAAPVGDSPRQLFALALGAVVQQTIEAAHRDGKVSPEAPGALKDDRPNCLAVTSGYRPKPLNGIWATAPFLHNGSVPTLQALLSPVAERPKVIWLGSLEFDPVAVGLASSEIANATRVDTSTPGNSNAGHEFSGDGTRRPGVIGRGLNPEERADLIEFLKSI